MAGHVRQLVSWWCGAKITKGILHWCVNIKSRITSVNCVFSVARPRCWDNISSSMYAQNPPWTCLSLDWRHYFEKSYLSLPLQLSYIIHKCPDAHCDT